MQKEAQVWITQYVMAEFHSISSLGFLVRSVSLSHGCHGSVGPSSRTEPPLMWLVTPVLSLHVTGPTVCSEKCFSQWEPSTSWGKLLKLKDAVISLTYYAKTCCILITVTAEWTGQLKRLTSYRVHNVLLRPLFQIVQAKLIFNTTDCIPRRILEPVQAVCQVNSDKISV